MTPKEKANELIQEMARVASPYKDDAKQCAIIAVKEVISQWEYIDTYLANLNGELNNNLKFWQSVLIELKSM